MNISGLFSRGIFLVDTLCPLQGISRVPFHVCHGGPFLVEIIFVTRRGTPRRGTYGKHSWKKYQNKIPLLDLLEELHGGHHLELITWK